MKHIKIPLFIFCLFIFFKGHGPLILNNFLRSTGYAVASTYNLSLPISLPEGTYHSLRKRISVVWTKETLSRRPHKLITQI